MTVAAKYADGRNFPLPPGWVPVEQHVLDGAIEAAGDALGASAVDRVSDYYDPAGNYSGNLLSSEDGYSGVVGPNDVDPADLFAVSTLSMQISPLAARNLIRPSETKRRVSRALAAVPTGLPITSLDVDKNHQGRVLEALEEAYQGIRGARAEDSNAWVFASKLLARKRPYLAPVRDNLVCTLLNGGAAMKRPGIGTFRTDIQVYAYLMSHSAITTPLAAIRHALGEDRRRLELEPSDLRLLDVVLWTQAVGHWD